MPKLLSTKYKLALLFIGLSISLVCISILVNKVNAAIYETISVQGKIVNTNGTNINPSCVGAGTCDFRFTIYDAAAAGNNLWQETQSNIPVTDGVFNLRLGSITSLNDVDLQNFNRDDLYVETEFDPSGNGDFAEGETFNPRVRLGAAPYAMNSKYLGGKLVSEFVY